MAPTEILEYAQLIPSMSQKSRMSTPDDPSKGGKGQPPFAQIRGLMARLNTNLRSTLLEQYLVVLLDDKDEVIDLVALADGTFDGAGVHPRDVVRLILDRDAVAVIFVHSHPHRSPEPSKADQNLNARLERACQSIDVKVRDHLIIGDSGTYSFVRNGLL